MAVAPRNGSLESYSDTTEGSEVFYRCDPGLVPEGTLTAVCTRNGWSPNPADLRCAGRLCCKHSCVVVTITLPSFPGYCQLKFNAAYSYPADLSCACSNLYL